MLVGGADGGVVEGCHGAIALAGGGLGTGVRVVQPVCDELPVGGAIIGWDGIGADEVGADAFGVALSCAHGDDGDACAHGLDDGVAATFGIFVEEQVARFEVRARIGERAGEDAALDDGGEHGMQAGHVAWADADKPRGGCALHERNEIVREAACEETICQAIADAGEGESVCRQTEGSARSSGDGGCAGGVASGGFDAAQGDVARGDDSVIALGFGRVVVDDSVDAGCEERDANVEADLQRREASEGEGGLDGTGGAGDEHGGVEASLSQWRDCILCRGEMREGCGQDGDGAQRAQFCEHVCARSCAWCVGQLEELGCWIAARVLFAQDDVRRDAFARDVVTDEAQQIGAGGVALREAGHAVGDAWWIAWRGRGDEGWEGCGPRSEQIAGEVGEEGTCARVTQEMLLVLLDVGECAGG